MLELSANSNNDRIAEVLDVIDFSAPSEQEGISATNNEPMVTFDEVVRELNDVKSLVGERGTKRHLLGRLLDNECYIIPSEVVLGDETVTSISSWSQDAVQTLSHADTILKKVAILHFPWL